MEILLSIKPEFVEQIFNGEKRFEYRRVIFRNVRVYKVVIYASSPIQKVVGEFEIDGILHKPLKELWKLTHAHSGISKDYFFEYFIGKSEGFALKVKNARRYKRPKCILEEYNVLPPQSFVYVKE